MCSLLLPDYSSRDADPGRELAARGEGELAEPHVSAPDEGRRRRHRSERGPNGIVVVIALCCVEEQAEMVQGRQGKAITQVALFWCLRKETIHVLG